MKSVRSKFQQSFGVAAVLASFGSADPPADDDQTQELAADKSLENTGTRDNDRNSVQLLFRAVLWVLWVDLALAVIIGGWWVRTWAWQQTEPIRYQGDINNAFRIGREAIGMGFLDYYDYCVRLDEEADVVDTNYAPARLLIATQWARWVTARLSADGPLELASDETFYQRARLLRRANELCTPSLII